jgi:CRISPR-associated protein Csm3
LELVKNDSLGGHGSRGYGAVEFTITALQERTMRHYREGKPAENVANELQALFKNLMLTEAVAEV